MADKAKKPPKWQSEFKFNPPKKLGGLRRFERDYRDVAFMMRAMDKKEPVMLPGTLGDSSMYLCAAIDSGFIESPAAARDGDAYTMDGINILDADVKDYARIIWCGSIVAKAMREITSIPFG